MILGIFGVAIAATAFSMWYHFQGSYRAREFWGTPTAVLIAQAPEVELLRLTAIAGESATTEPAEAGSQEAQRERLSAGGQHYRILASKPVGKAHGVSNVRRALVLDPTFDWNGPKPDTKPEWQYAIDFRDGARSDIVLFDFDSRQVSKVGQSATALLNPAASGEIEEFCAEQF